MAGTRVPRNGQTRKSELADSRAQKLLRDISPETGATTYARGPRPTTARSIAEIASSIISAQEESKLVRNRATKLLQRWAGRAAPEQASKFWSNPDNRAKYGFYTHLHMLGSTVLSHQALADLLTNQPDEALGSEFSPRRQALVSLASGALVKATGSIELVKAYEQPIPAGLQVVTESSMRWMENTAVPFPDRLADYAESLRQYEASLTEKQYVSR